jgi:ubiquinone/menaquinone biosynthesis C-methylase UbiE
MKLPWLFTYLLSTFFFIASCQAQQESSYYELKEASRDGTGKFYMDREIAHVMGYQGATWLERKDREKEERTDLLIQALALQPTDVVADMGAGTGYFTFRMSPRVPKGKVLAVDIQPEMIAYLEENKAKHGAKNVETVLCTEQNPNLPPNTVDVVLLVDAYHEFSYPREVMGHIVKALKPNGRVALVEYRAEDPEVQIKPLHKMTVEQAVKEMKAVGLHLIENKTLLPQQHLMLFGKEAH